MLTRTLLTRAILLRRLQNAGDSLKQTKRNAGHGVWTYRVPPPMPSKKSIRLAQGLGGLCWWWILYHIATEPEHITGEWPYIDPSTWTDEELGIPPDSAGCIKH
ncbi:NADH dehydrogenase [ubiquinone] 1 beta subcomplex subunit 2, mitochondrial-like [Bombyx mandarina]|uniref:NADH dehydrogenase [ubiquinone] 1 beta subcomplex subunit 2, mitochondrial n=2 Tax=Bombyx TaxID=7090 RepID=A0A8R2ALG8_BOMMO|nr:NADH dehydrogenase [ubiquinone] 1 beta subcomplex subunit 2, mitochondrial [Bombyx mori]XP_028025954.1 NADH dehydrogenase [ubiquinone] 1 beta subcomplex subunit 2, mitochondrial-like [Bombyx mandarina]